MNNKLTYSNSFTNTQVLECILGVFLIALQNESKHAE